jgi:hypothetical protein
VARSAGPARSLLFCGFPPSCPVSQGGTRQAGGQGRQRSECRPHISSASPRLASPPSSAFTARRRSSGLARIGAAAVCCMCMDVHVCMDLHAGKKSVCTIPCLHEKCASAAIAIPVFFAHHSPILSLLTQASLTPSGRSHSRLTAGSLAYLHPSPRCFTRLLTLRFAKQSLSTTSLHRTHLHTSAPEDYDVPRTVAVSCGAG